RGEVARRFSDIEECARDFQTKIDSFAEGSVVALQIGNHEDWPSILIACLRKRLVVLPLEQSISHHQRSAAVSVSRASALLNCGVIPISHSYGFSNLLTPLVARGVPMVLSRERMPRAVLIDLARTNTTVFPGMPVFYQAFSEMENIPALPKLRLCISAGAPL